MYFVLSKDVNQLCITYMPSLINYYFLNRYSIQATVLVTTALVRYQRMFTKPGHLIDS